VLQVLQHLPNRFSADVFCKLTDSSGSVIEGCKRALCLPQNLRSHWVASTPAVLDLRTAVLTAVQQSRLFAALLQGGTHLTEFHVQVVPSGLADAGVAAASMNLIRGSLQQCSDMVETYAGHYGYTNLQPMLCDLTKLIESNYEMHAFGRNSAFNIDCQHVLDTLAGVLPQLTSLRHVGLHNLPLQTQLMPVLGHVMMSVPPSVTALTLATAASVLDVDVGPFQKSMLFEAISLVRSLRELHMPNWENLVGHDAACFEPLFQLPHLEVVYVSQVKTSAAFSAQLVFKEEAA
jgi:hypothetical protein